jgi:membrane-associated protease RseP (regulator of RpoE activity)
LHLTSAIIAEQSLWSWGTCIGIIALFSGIVNLLPVPVLNGGRIALETYAAVFGRIRNRTFVLLHMVGLALVLVVIGRILWLDLMWLIGLL